MFVQNNLVSVLLNQQFIYSNYRSSTYIQTLNYSVKTGKAIAFQELFNTNNQSEIDSIIISELKIWHAEFEMDYTDDNVANWK